MFTDGISHRPLHEVLNLYHGSKSGLQGNIQPHFRSARKKCDFGQGFYMGTKRQQAETLIAGHESPVLYSVRLDPEGLACLNLDGMAWALFVAYNREHLYGPQNERLRVVLSDIAKGVNLIVGPIADDRMNHVLKQFFAGNITDTVLLHCMRDMDLGTQYVAVTEKACRRITIVDEHALTDDETARLMNRQTASTVRACSSYNRQGADTGGPESTSTTSSKKYHKNWRQNDMRPDSILMDVCDNQGELFEYSALLGYNSEEFVKGYMSSRIARRMYSFYDSIQMMDRAYVLEEFLDEVPVPCDGNTWDPEAMWWTGYIYRYWGSYKQVGPPAIYGIVDGLTMVSLHPGYHTLDDEQAIDRLYELHGAALERKKAGTPPTA